MPRPKPRRLAALTALSLVLVACGGGDAEDPGTTTAGQDATTTTQTASPTTEATQPTTTTAATSSASIEVDGAALPTDPSGYDTWSGDICSLYTPEELDAFFVGQGELATIEPLDRGCRWAVEGFPRSHYVDIEVLDDGSDTIFQIVEQIDVSGTQVDIGHGPEDIVAMIPAPDGTYLRLLIHGDFGAPPGPLNHYLDDAAAGLSENLVSRF